MKQELCLHEEGAREISIFLILFFFFTFSFSLTMEQDFTRDHKLVKTWDSSLCK